ncbi:MAG: WD40 repeat domain-containing protein, partial [Actinomycetota bacterium]
SVAFSPDGRVLASGSSDGGIILWDVAQRSRLTTLTDHTDGVASVAFSPDGRGLASGSSDNNVILWDVDAASWRRRLCSIVGRGLTRDEWATYVEGLSYRPACGKPK